MQITFSLLLLTGSVSERDTDDKLREDRQGEARIGEARKQNVTERILKYDHGNSI